LAQKKRIIKSPDLTKPSAENYGGLLIVRLNETAVGKRRSFMGIIFPALTAKVPKYADCRGNIAAKGRNVGKRQIGSFRT
jgi:hypothetical protein